LGTPFAGGLATGLPVAGLAMDFDAAGPLPVDPRESVLLPITLEELGLDLRAWSLERFFFFSARSCRAGMGRINSFLSNGS
jgi:hypothetical protein